MQVNCQLLTPLHIGGAESSVQPMAFICLNKRVYVVNEQKLTRELAAENLIDDFVKSLPQEGTHFSLRDYLEKRRLSSPEFIKKIAEYSCGIEGEFRFDFRAFIRNAFSQPYIPGTSIKGVWRTAVTYCALKRLPEAKRKSILEGSVKRVMSSIQQGRTAGFWQKNTVFKHEEESLFQSFGLPNCKSGIHTDFFRVIKLTDSEPFDKNALDVRNVDIYSVLSQESPKQYPIRAECLPTGTRFTFSWKIDEVILGDFKKNNKSTVHPWGITFGEFEALALKPIECAREMTQDVITEENDFFLDYFKEPYPLDDKPDFHLGWGGSLLSASVSLLMDESFRKEFRNKFFKDRGNAPAPKSRKRLQKSPQSGAVLGWVKII